VRLKIDDSN
jgi:ankyrin repeat protein